MEKLIKNTIIKTYCLRHCCQGTPKRAVHAEPANFYHKLKWVTAWFHRFSVDFMGQTKCFLSSFCSIVRFEMSPHVVRCVAALHNFECHSTAAVEQCHPGHMRISQSHGVYVTAVENISPNAQFITFGCSQYIFKATRPSLVQDSLTPRQLACCTITLECWYIELDGCLKLLRLVGQCLTHCVVYNLRNL